MAFPIELTVALSGATKHQLYSWNKKGLLSPEISTDRIEGFLWSFRDIVALRTFIKLRSDHSLQAIRKALTNLRELSLTEHPSTYTLTSDGTSVFLVEDDGKNATDLLRERGQKIITNLDDVLKGFRHPSNKGDVVDLLHPRKRLEVNEGKLGGFPTIRGTRVAYDTIANLIYDGEVRPKDVELYFPDVTAADAKDALDFYHQVERGEGWVA
ncbi:putative toxin-antitoxin system, antitoxin component [Corynebacterium efficiens YS-314]|nr:DUF433 domain-containing protein [Corynebacterium efficiens]EEW50461.1 putative toxin-antitoxin system, antitoxin component [Corynebacterium efficiens YS-314]